MRKREIKLIIKHHSTLYQEEDEVY